MKKGAELIKKFEISKQKKNAYSILLAQTVKAVVMTDTSIHTYIYSDCMKTETTFLLLYFLLLMNNILFGNKISSFQFINMSTVDMMFGPSREIKLSFLMSIL